MRVQIANLRPGMVLTEPVIDAFSQSMVASGTTLTRNRIMALKAWGIGFAEVESGDPVEPQLKALNQTALSQAFDRLDRRMSWKTRHVMEEEIYTLSVEFAARRIMNGETATAPWTSPKTF